MQSTADENRPTEEIQQTTAPDESQQQQQQQASTHKRKRDPGEEESEHTTGRRTSFRRTSPGAGQGGPFLPVNGAADQMDPNLDPSFAAQQQQQQQQQASQQASQQQAQPQQQQSQQASQQQEHNQHPASITRTNTAASSQMSQGGSQPNPKPQVGTEEWHRLRKDNHKEVERRRRETINEGINELAKIVPGCEKNKGSILQRAVQYITQLKENEATNIEKWTLERLLQEQALSEMSAANDKLKGELERAWREAETWKKACLGAGVNRNDAAVAAAAASTSKTNQQ